MGHRDDDFLDDEQAEAGLRRLLARWGEPDHVDAPPDLVTRMARRLPSEPPALAARSAIRQRNLRFAAGAVLAAPLVLLVLLSLLNAIDIGPQLVLLFGDGTSGISRLLLMIQLIAKPLVGIVLAAGGVWWLTCAGAAVGFVGLWRWTFGRTPAHVYAEKRS